MITLLLAAALTALAGDPTQGEPAAVKPLVRVQIADLPAMDPEGDLASYATGIEREIDACAREKNGGRTIVFGTRALHTKTWCVNTGKKMLELARASKSWPEFYAATKTQFEWYKSTGKTGTGDMLVTGYNSPILNASRVRDAGHPYPIYKKPDDLVQIVKNGRKIWAQQKADGSYAPYPERAAISNGALAGRGLELVWVDDKFSAFIFEVQGAGVALVTGKDGKPERMILNYAAQNGQPYVSLSSVFKARGIDKQYWTIPGMRLWFKDHPDQLDSMLNENPSVVFFAEADQGPNGATGTALVPGHSIAIDPKVLPLSGMALVKATKPGDHVGGVVSTWLPFARFAIAHDIGGAIQGAGHLDFFWGEDDFAELAAGTMAQAGELYFAVIPENESYVHPKE